MAYLKGDESRGTDARMFEVTLTVSNAVILSTAFC